MDLWTASNNLLLRQVEEGKSLREPNKVKSREAILQPIYLNVDSGTTFKLIV